PPPPPAAARLEPLARARVVARQGDGALSARGRAHLPRGMHREPPHAARLRGQQRLSDGRLPHRAARTPRCGVPVHLRHAAAHAPRAPRRRPPPPPPPPHQPPPPRNPHRPPPTLPHPSRPPPHNTRPYTDPPLAPA